MIRICAGNNEDQSLSIVKAAFARSVTASQITLDQRAPIYVFINPSCAQAVEIGRLMAENVKIVVFGAWPGACDFEDGWVDAVECEPTQPQRSSASAASVVWDKSLDWVEPPLGRKFPVKRFDFSDEWNNLGYGAIGVGGLWGLAGGSGPPDAMILARVIAPGLTPLSYVTLKDNGSSALLWWNRPVGPVDHPDWVIIERFMADFGAGRLPCQPIIEEVPFTYDAALTMRLDCDEDIGSASELFALYRDQGIPFSLAIMTGQEQRPGCDELLRAVYESGGGILTHSATHAPNWGGSSERCAAELAASCEWISCHLSGFKPRHAVSPFHQSPVYLPQMLADHGLCGFIGGIIANDPETLVARGGVLPGGPESVVTHSQQCMLHGDCMMAEGDPLQIPKAALTAAVKGRALFGYLDHPISPRYDYGWGSAAAQLAVHGAMLNHVAEFYPKACWMSADVALDWISAKSRISLYQNALGKWRGKGPTGLAEWQFAMRFEGEVNSLAEIWDD